MAPAQCEQQSQLVTTHKQILFPRQKFRFNDAIFFLPQYNQCPCQQSIRTANAGCQQRYFGGKIKSNVYNIPPDGKLRVNFTGRYLSRSGLTAISIRMDPDSVFSQTQTWTRLCSSVFSAPRHGELLYSASLKWRRCDYTRSFIDQPSTLLDRPPQNVNALEVPIRCFRCPSK